MSCYVYNGEAPACARTAESSSHFPTLIVDLQTFRPSSADSESCMRYQLYEVKPDLLAAASAYSNLHASMAPCVTSAPWGSVGVAGDATPHKTQGPMTPLHSYTWEARLAGIFSDF